MSPEDSPSDSVPTKSGESSLKGEILRDRGSSVRTPRSRSQRPSSAEAIDVYVDSSVVERSNVPQPSELSPLRSSEGTKCGALWGQAASVPSTSAMTLQLDRAVAIKVLHSELARPPAEGDQFLEEARKLARLRHPGIVTVHDVGVHEGRVYLVSDYLDGPDLGRWLRDNRVAWPEATRIAAAVADALAHAHARLIVHRDVKPANITPDRRPRAGARGLRLGSR